MKKNQGFSLVELIVVIAIMAVLVGVLAPAYLRYVEKSRKSSDVSSVSDIVAAAEKVAVDVQFDLKQGAKFTVSVANGKVSISVANGTTDADADAALTEWVAIATGKEGQTSGANIYTCKSKEFKAAAGDGTIEGVIQASGSLAWSGAGFNNKKSVLGYSADFVGKYKS